MRKSLASLCVATAMTGSASLHANISLAAAMDMTHADHSAHAPRYAFGQPAQAGAADRTMTVIVHDLVFEPKDLAVRPNETVRFLVTNTSTIDHEFTLGDAATERAHRKEMARLQQLGQPMNHDHANAVTVPPGQTRELTWTFGGAGRLEFDCNIPGHYESGMRGTITVRADAP